MWLAGCIHGQTVEGRGGAVEMRCCTDHKRRRRVQTDDWLTQKLLRQPVQQHAEQLVDDPRTDRGQQKLWPPIGYCYLKDPNSQVIK